MPKSTAKRDRAILALLVESTIVAAAARAGVAEVTLHRWFKDPNFRREYERARERYLDECASELARQRVAGAVLLTRSLPHEQRHAGPLAAAVAAP